MAAAVVLVLSVGYLWEAHTYRFGSPANPGAGMFPVVIGIALLLAAAVVLAAEYSGQRRASGEGTAARAQPAVDQQKGPPKLRLLVPFVVTAALYPLAIRIVGFELATALALPGMAFSMGERRPLRLLLLAAGGVAATYLVFRLWLAVPLP